MTSEYGNPHMITRTWHVWREQAQAIANLADGLGIPHGVLVRYLLTFALREVAAGRLVLRTRPSRYELVEDL